MMSNPGDYYARKDAERRALFAEWTAAAAELDALEDEHGALLPTTDPAVYSALYARVLRLERRLEQVSYVGD
jgi:hypothetical protein